MKSQFQRWRVAATMLCLLSPVQAFAGQDASFEQRTRKAVALSNAVTAVERGFGEFVEARSSFTRTKGGVSERIMEWQRYSLEWVQGWFEVFAWADLEDPVGFAAFEKRLDELVSKQHADLETLRSQADQLERELVTTSRLFRRTELPGKPEALQTYVGVFEAFQKIQEKANTDVASLQGLLSERIVRLKEVSRVSHKVILAHLESALLEEHLYPLKESIQRIDALLKDRDLVDPILNKLTASEARASELGLNLHLFELEQLAKSAKEECQKAEQELDRAGAERVEIERAKNRVGELCASIQEHNSFLKDLGMEDAELVYELVNVEKYDLDELCVNSESPAQECEKLAVLAAFELKDLVKMSREELRFVETEWTDNLRAARKSKD